MNIIATVRSGPWEINVQDDPPGQCALKLFGDYPNEDAININDAAHARELANVLLAWADDEDDVDEPIGVVRAICEEIVADGDSADRGEYAVAYEILRVLDA